MKEQPLRTSVVGSYPFPAWLESCSGRLDEFGTKDIEEMQDDATAAAIGDQLRSGLDVITGKKMRAREENESEGRI